MRKVLGWAGGLAAALVVAWGVMHVVIPPVNPEQEPPREHYFEAECWTCHLVLDSAELKALDQDE